MLYGGIFFLSTGGAMMLQYKPKKSLEKSDEPIIDNPIEIVETPAEKLLNYITGNEGIIVDGNIGLSIKEIDVDLALKGSISLADLENISVNAELGITVDGELINANVSYVDGVIALDVLNNHFKLATDNVLDFINMLPTYGLQLELPEEFSTIDIDALTNQLGDLKEEDKKQYSNGEYYFPFSFAGLDIGIKTDEDEKDRFLGARIDDASLMGIDLSADLDIISASKEELNIIDPLKGENAKDYIDFKYAFNLFDSIYNLVKQDQIMLNVSAQVANEEKGLDLGANVDIGLDVKNQLYTLEGNVTEKGRTHDFIAAYQDYTVYAGINKINVSLEDSTILDLINYILVKLDKGGLEDVLNTVTASLSDIQVGALINKLTNTLGKLSMDEEKASIELNFNALGLDVGNIVVEISYNQQGLTAITLKDLNIKGTSVDVVLTFKDYVAPSFNKEKFVAIDPAYNLIETFEKLIKQTQFNLEFDAVIDRKQENLKDITLDGNIQFDIENMFGYGNVLIVDSKDYKHNIKADMKSPENIIFSYNDTLKGKFNTDTMVELKSLILNVVENPDKHFIELYADLLDSLENSPIIQVINGDYGLLLEYNLIDNLVITDKMIECDVYLDILELDMDKIHLCFEYGKNDQGETLIKNLNLSNIDFGTCAVEINAKVSDYDPSLESTRLDANDNYLDFSDIKVLLELGINTSKFEYYHITGTANVSLVGFDVISIPMEVKVRNDNGDVQVDAQLKSVPTIVGVNKELLTFPTRSAAIYYQGDYLYIYRYDQFMNSSKNIHYSRRCTVDFFVSNIVEILCKDMLGFTDMIMKSINQSESQEKAQIQYENILQDFKYTKEENKDYFQFAISLMALTGSSILKNNLILDVNADPVKHMLTSVDLSLDISLGITIGVKANFKLESDTSTELTESNRLTNLEAYLKAHENDALNQLITF